MARLMIVVMLGALVLAACEDEPKQIRVCRDSAGVIQDDTKCRANTNPSAFYWWYLMGRRGGYPIGSSINGGSPTALRGQTVQDNSEAHAKAAQRAKPTTRPSTGRSRPVHIPRARPGGFHR